MIVRITRPDWNGHALVFDTDDIAEYATPHDVTRTADGAWRFTGTSHLNLTFKQDRHAHWELP